MDLQLFGAHIELSDIIIDRKDIAGRKLEDPRGGTTRLDTGRKRRLIQPAL
jgi:hypothetical protein